jgi:serine/threonine protein phosphatase PrpC
MSICFSTTLSGKIDNEDACIHLNGEQGMKFFAVADGLGTYKAAAKASHQVVEYIRENAGSILPDSDVLAKLFRDIQVYLSKLALRAEYQDADKEHLLGTTLILGIETDNRVMFAYTGNGAIIHVRGTVASFTGFGKRIYPWFAANILNPHTIPENGAEVLYRFLSNDGAIDCKPSIITVDKDDTEGDAFIICTDGVVSQDHIGFMRGGDSLYTKYEVVLHELYVMLRDLQNVDAAKDSSDPATRLQMGMESFMKTNNARFEDDATLGVLVTEPFYQRTIY